MVRPTVSQRHRSVEGRSSLMKRTRCQAKGRSPQAPFSLISIISVLATCLQPFRQTHTALRPGIFVGCYFVGCANTASELPTAGPAGLSDDVLTSRARPVAGSARTSDVTRQLDSSNFGDRCVAKPREFAECRKQFLIANQDPKLRKASSASERSSRAILRSGRSRTSPHLRHAGRERGSRFFARKEVEPIAAHA